MDKIIEITDAEEVADWSVSFIDGTRIQILRRENEISVNLKKFIDFKQN